jgi:hypothetical protein
MIRKLFLEFSILLLLAVPAAGATPGCSRVDTQDHIEIIATVVAYNLSVLSVAKLTSVPNDDVILVRIKRVLAGHVKSRYVIVHYQYWDSEPRLPDGFHNAKAQWRLELNRDSTCDKSFSEALSKKNKPGLVVLVPLQRPHGKKVRLVNERISCYVLHPNGLSLYRKAP